MKPHPALRQQMVEKLKASLDGEEAPSTSEATPFQPPSPRSPSEEVHGIKGAVKRLIRKAIAWYVVPAAERAAASASNRLDQRAAGRFAEVELRIDELADVRSVPINLELLKGELRAFQQTLDELGMAIAPATGLAGARERLAELRERLNAVERRTRDRGEHPPPQPPPTRGVESSPAADSTAPGTPRPASASLDYVGFERRFRGDPERVLTDLKERYLELLSEHQPVLDLGCGKGELLATLRDAGDEALGVDLDPGMVAEARERGLEVYEEDAVAFLRSRPEHSLGSIIAVHVLEHLQLDDLVNLLELSVTRLRPGGIFVAETPNPASLIVLGNSYILDPTHVRPLHPSLMVYLCESAGFRDVRLQFHSPATDYHLPPIEDPSAPEWVTQINQAFETLNDVLFGPQEYAVIATAP